MTVNINPLLLDTAAPPIPEVQAWSAAYRGALGPAIDLSQAVPGYPPPEAMLRMLAETAGTPAATAYGDILGDPELRAAYAGDLSAVYRGRVAADEVAITAGCNQAFFLAMIAVARAGDAVMLPLPWYFNHKMTLDMLGIVAMPLPCRAENSFVPDPGDAEPLIDPRVRAIVLITPNNPTGAVYPPATIRGFAELCARRGLALVVDETYRDFIAAEPPHDLLETPDWRTTAILLYSFSKAYSIPGHRMGALAANARFLEEIAKIADCMQICPSRTPQPALAWALPALSDWRAKNRDEILRRAAIFQSAFADLAGWSIGSIGAYFAYVRHPFAGSPANAVARWLAEERGLLCLPGSYFGPGQEDYLRVAFANVDPAAIRELPERLRGSFAPQGKLATAGGRA